MANKIKKIVLDSNDKNFTGRNGAENIIGNKLSNMINGAGGNDTITGGKGNDNLIGGLGDDTIIAGVGKDKVDGGIGNDTLSLEGNFADAIITENVDGSVVIKLGAGTTTAKNIESFKFSDGTVTAADLVNDAPTGASTAVVAGTEDALLSITSAQLLQGFTDPNTGDTLTVVGLAADHGTVTANLDGSFSIAINANYSGPLVLTYQVSDGDKSIAATNTVNVVAVNDAPTGDSTAALAAGTEDLAFSVTAAELLAGFSDIDGNTLSVTDLAADHGTVTVNSNGTFTITPDADFNGTVTLTYKVSDGALTIDATNTVIVGAVNDAPTLVTPIADQATAEGNNFTFAVPVGTFADIDSNTLTLTATLANGNPLPAWLTFANGVFSGTPTDGTNGTISVKVTASDGTLSATDTFDIAIADTIKQLTTGVDALSLTAFSETISGDSSTFQLTDSITDTTTTDDDVLNLTLTAASPQAVVRGVEHINVNWNALNFAEFDAKFISGATITVGSTKVGYAGDVLIDSAGANKIVAGDGAKGALGVYGGTSVVVDAGAAAHVYVEATGTAADDVSANITAGAATTTAISLGFKSTTIIGSAATTDIQIQGQSTLTDHASITVVNQTALTLVTVENVDISASPNAEITLNTALGLVSNSITSTGPVKLIAGSSEIAGLQLTNSANGLTIDMTNDTFSDVDLTNVEFDLLNFKNALQSDIYVASGANLRADVDLNPGASQFGGYRIYGTTSNVDSVTLTLTVDQTDVEAFGGFGKNIEQFHIISALSGSDAGGVLDIGCLNAVDVDISGSNELHILFASVDSLDASAVTGAVTIDAVDDFGHLVTSILGSATAKNTVFFANESNKVAYTGGSDMDVITATQNLGGFVTADLGNGDNSFAGTVDNGIISVTSGNGQDLINVKTLDNTFDVFGATVSVVSGGGDDEVSIGLDFGGQALTIKLGAGEDALDFKGTSTTAEDVISIDGGTEIDTIDLAGGDLTLGTMTVTNVEQLNDSTGTSIVSGALLHNAAFTILGNGVGIQLSVALGSTNGNYNFSGLTIDSTSGGLFIIGSSVDDAVIGSAARDTMLLGDGTNVFQGGQGFDDMYAGAGSDRFVFSDVDADKDTSLLVISDQVDAFVGGAGGDRFDFTTAGSATNYQEMQFADTSNLVADADAILDGTVKYLVVEAQDQGRFFLFYDNDGKGFTSIVELTNFASLSDIQFSDIT